MFTDVLIGLADGFTLAYIHERSREQGWCLQYVARPPEMSNTAPVENAQSSDASHATIAASSSTRTKRPFGIFDSMKSMCCCVIWSKIAVLAAAGVTALTAIS